MNSVAGRRFYRVTWRPWGAPYQRFVIVTDVTLAIRIRRAMALLYPDGKVVFHTGRLL